MVQLRGGLRTLCGAWFSSLFATDLGHWILRTLEVPFFGGGLGDPLGLGGWRVVGGFLFDNIFLRKKR